MFISVIIIIAILWYIISQRKKGNSSPMKYILGMFIFYTISSVLIQGPQFLSSSDAKQVLLWVMIAVVGIALFIAARKVMPMALRDKGLSNSFIYVYFALPWSLVMFSVAAALCGIFDGFGAVLGALAGIVGWVYGLMRLNNTLKLRCNNCRVYPGDVSWGGMVKDGIKEERNHRVGGYTETNRDGREVSDITTNTYTTEYYQMYKERYHCNLCGHRWDYSIRGELTGRDVRQNKNTKTTTYE